MTMTRDQAIAALMWADEHENPPVLRTGKNGKTIVPHTLLVRGVPEEFNDEELLALAAVGLELDKEATPAKKLPKPTEGAPANDNQVAGYAEAQMITFRSEYKHCVVKHRKWEATASNLAEMLSKLYRHRLLTADHWVCLRDMVPRKVTEVVRAGSTPVYRVEGKDYDYETRHLVLAAGTEEDLKRLLALYRAG
ncbi:MAG: hypothetical protein GC129_00770 [Proteobacteria bacterium]|nr:hypothetical protein [Pseudomonadota bacterium]